jgi:hypothetical protein
MTKEEFSKLDKDVKKEFLIRQIATTTQSVKDYEVLKNYCKGGTRRAREEMDKANDKLLDAIGKHGQAKINLRAMKDMLHELEDNK